MTDPVFGRLRELFGPEGVERSPDGSPVATPDSTDAVAHLCQLAGEEGWRIRTEGRGTWLEPDAPCDLAVRLRALDQVTTVSPEDLVATIQAGAPIDAVAHQLAERGMRLALDPPGKRDRSLGSIVATATSGPGRLGYGAVKDHILGCTVVTGDGRVVRSGGRVVKNVAGYDITRLQVGGFGAFGILTEIHCRLRALPRADETRLARGHRNVLLAVARDTLEAGLAPVMLELFSPALAGGPDWVLATRFQGGGSAVHADVGRLPQGKDVVWERVPPERSSTFWAMVARATLGADTTVRLAALPPGLDDLLDLVAHDLDENLLSAGCGDGTVRWTGQAAPERLTALRRAAAVREIPLTLERGGWALRSAVGHFGEYRENVGTIVRKLRQTFDPGGVFTVALDTGEE